MLSASCAASSGLAGWVADEPAADCTGAAIVSAAEAPSGLAGTSGLPLPSGLLPSGLALPGLALNPCGTAALGIVVSVRLASGTFAKDAGLAASALPEEPFLFSA